MNAHSVVSVLEQQDSTAAGVMPVSQVSRNTREPTRLQKMGVEITEPYIPLLWKSLVQSMLKRTAVGFAKRSLVAKRCFLNTMNSI